VSQRMAERTVVRKRLGWAALICGFTAVTLLAGRALAGKALPRQPNVCRG